MPVVTIGYWRSMKKIVPLNTTGEGCAFTIVTRYEARAYLKGMTSGGGYYPCTGVLEIISDGDTEDTASNEKGFC